MTITYQILVSNKSNLAKAEIVDVFPGDTQFTANESMQAFIAQGGTFETWNRQFSLIKGTDKSFDDMLYLVDYNDVGDRKYFFIEPAKATQIWQDLYYTGETTNTTAQILEHVGIR